MNSIEARFAEMERVILQDPGGRGVAALARPGEVLRACLALKAAKRVGIITGFFIPTAGACETDGPLGAAHLATLLLEDADVVVCTDQWCLPVVQGLIQDASNDPACLLSCDVLVAVERLGRSADGRYYTMRGTDATAWTAPLDELFLAKRPGQKTVAIGDGGNEVGMGLVRDRVREAVPLGDLIGSVVPADHLIVAGVSNWGAWALAAGLVALGCKGHLPTSAAALADLETLVASGAVDGITGRSEPTIDGLPWQVHAEVLEELRSIAQR